MQAMNADLCYVTLQLSISSVNVHRGVSIPTAPQCALGGAFAEQ